MEKYNTVIPEMNAVCRYLINANFASHFAGIFKTIFNLLISSLVYNCSLLATHNFRNYGMHLALIIIIWKFNKNNNRGKK